MPVLRDSSTLASDECKSCRRNLRKAASLQNSLLANWDMHALALANIKHNMIQYCTYI